MKLMFFLLGFVSCVSVHGQTSSDPFLNFLGSSSFDCDNINERNLKLWPALISENKVDSALFIFEMWDASCPNYFVLSLKTLYAIEYDSLENIEDLLYNLEFIAWYSNRHQLPYKKEKNGVETKARGFKQPYSVIENKEEEVFWNTIKAKALQVAETKNKGTFSHNMAQFLAHKEKPLFQSFKKADYIATPTILIENYKKNKKERSKALRGDAALYISSWIPQGNIKLLGIHPGVGMHLGASQNYWRILGKLNVHFFPSPNEYKVLQADTLVSTKRFIHFSFGAEGSRILWRTEKNELSIGLGVGYSGIEAVENTLDEEEEESNSVILHSIDAFAGFEYRYYYRRTTYIGVGAGYHLNDFRNTIDNTLSGNTITVRLLFGFSEVNGGKSLNAFGLR